MISKIVLRSSADIVISANKATITGSDIEYLIEDGTLSVSQKQQYINCYSNGYINIIGSTISGVSFGGTRSSSKTITIDGEYLISEVTLAGSGDIIIGEDCCNSSFTGTIAGSGSVKGTASPTCKVTKTIVGSGKIRL